MQKSFLNWIAGLFLVVVMASCSKSSTDKTVWVYTSMFPETVALFEKALKEKHPDIQIKWFQNGSENIAAKIALEQLSGQVQADLVLTADLFWVRKMAKTNFWLNYSPKLSYDIPEKMRGANGEFTAPRISATVLVYNKSLIKPEEAPKSFAELADPKFKGKVSTGSPLESGTSYMFYMNIAYKYGEDFLKKMRANDVMSAGGNSAVMKRLTTGEYPIGVVVFETVLNDLKNNPNLGYIIPSDGAILSPGPMAIVGETDVPAEAKKVYDYFLSAEGQQLNADSLVYVPDPQAKTPQGLPTLSELMKNSFEWSDAFLEFAESQDDTFKEKFSKIMLE